MELMEFFQQTGRKGGKQRMASLTAEERRKLARKAGLASGKARAKKAKARRAGERASS